MHPTTIRSNYVSILPSLQLPLTERLSDRHGNSPNVMAGIFLPCNKTAKCPERYRRRKFAKTVFNTRTATIPFFEHSRHAQRYICFTISDWAISESCDKGRWPYVGVVLPCRRWVSQNACDIEPKDACMDRNCKTLWWSVVAEFGEALVYRIFVTEWMLNNLPFLWNSVRCKVPWQLTKHKRGRQTRNNSCSCYLPTDPLKILSWVHRCFGENQQAILFTATLFGEAFLNHVCITEIVLNCQYCLFRRT